MKPAFKTAILLDSFQLNIDRALALSADLGVEGVQVYAVSEYMPENKLHSDHAVSLKKKIALHGLEITALCGDLGGHGFEDRKENRDKIEKTCEIIDFAAELGTSVVTSHIGVVPETDLPKRIVMQEALYRVCRHAEKRGVYYAVETGPEKAGVLKDFILEIGEKNLKVNFDPANIVMVQGEDPSRAVNVLKDLVVHTHAKDGRMFKKMDSVFLYDLFAQGNPEKINLDEYFVELPLGSGDVDYNRYLQALYESGYRGYLTIERESGTNRIKDISEAVAFLKSFEYVK